MTIGKTIALTGWTFVGKMVSLLFNTLSSFVIAFLPRIKYLLISRLQSPSAMILEPKKIKSATVSIFPHLFAVSYYVADTEYRNEYYRFHAQESSNISPPFSGLCWIKLKFKQNSRFCYRKEKWMFCLSVSFAMADTGWCSRAPCNLSGFLKTGSRIP